MKALMIGLGGVGQRHLRNILEICPDTEILSVRKRGRNYEILDDLTIDLSVDLMEKYKIKNFHNIKAAINEKPDVAVVATPSASHAEICSELLEEGIKVLVEKPAATTYNDFNSLAESSNLENLHVAYQLRYHSCFLKLKDILDSNSLGNVTGVEVSVRSYMPDWHKYEDFKSMYAARKDQGGGVVLTEIHELDLLSHLFGRAEVLFARQSNVLNLGVEDTILAVVEFNHKNRSILANIRLSFCQQTPERHFIVYCDNGTLEWRLNDNLKISKKESFKTVKPLEKNRNELFITLMSNFLNFENGKSLSFASSELGLRCALDILKMIKR